MADVTIAQLTQGVPSSSSLIPYSTGSSTLGAPVSAMFQNTSSVSINSTTPYTAAKLHIKNTGAGPGGLGNSIRIENMDDNFFTGIDFINSNGINQTTIYQIGSQPAHSGYAGGTDALQIWNRIGATVLGTGNNTSMLITSGGYITTPRQPIFRASMTGGGGNQGAFIKVPFNYAPVNVGGHYNLTDKQFNVPVDGNYHFTAGHMNSQNNSGHGTIEIRKNNVRQCYFHNSNSHPMSTSWSIILQCSKGDYIDMWASNYHFGGAAELGYDYPTLMGYLIG